MASILAQFKRISDAFASGVEDAVQEAAIEGAIELVTRTPVKRGTARVNWVASLASPKAHFEDGPGAVDRGLNAGVATAVALSKALPIIRRFRLSHGSVFLCNSVPYILDLDSGSSTQAPAGMTSFGAKAAIDVLKARKII